jgi:hypothetical protein
MADTLMYGGAVLLLAGAMPHEGSSETSADQQPYEAREALPTHCY